MAEKHLFGVDGEGSAPQIGSQSHPTAPVDADYGETIHDVSDMKRLGKKQEFKVDFRREEAAA